ncbi:MAG: ATP-binding protein [Kangiellaceae bacterium]|jgi:two-component system sensor histidine kinase CpxA|nr:ATP-binding protein [Kangiellaceae bacterium]
MWPFNRLSLFWKIFIWFWFAMLLMVLTSIISWIIFRDSINVNRITPSMNGMLDKVAYIIESDRPTRRKQRLLQQILRTFGPPPVSKLRGKSKQLGQIYPFYLIDSAGVEHRYRPIPEAITVIQSRQAEKAYLVTQGDFIFAGPRQVNVEGKQQSLFLVQYIGRFKSRLIWHALNNISIWQLIGYLVVSVVICLSLAWSITKPIRSLRKVTNQVASGEKVSAVAAISSRHDEFYQLAVDLDEMAKKILATVNSQKQLLSDVSHELRSPLTRMQITLGLLEKDTEQLTQKYVARLQKECQTMDEMIGQLLKIAALERGQIYEEKQLVSIEDLINDVIADASFEASEHNITIKVDCSYTAEIALYYQLIYSAVENILRNAIRYSEPTGQILLEVARRADNIAIAIKDQGKGVAQSELSQLFEPFYRTESARTRTAGGAGLGLAIAQRAVAAHGGTITASANQPTGLIVTIELPYQKSQTS